MKARLSPDNYSGAPLLGLAGNILKLMAPQMQWQLEMH